MGVAALDRGGVHRAVGGYPWPIAAHAPAQCRTKRVYPMQRLDANRFHSTTDAVMVQKNGRGRDQQGGLSPGQPRRTPETSKSECIRCKAWKRTDFIHARL